MSFKRILTAGLLGCSMLANAEVTHMTVELNSGSKINFLLDDNPVITLEKVKYGIHVSQMVINGDAATTYAIDDVKYYYFTKSDNTSAESKNATNNILVSLLESSVIVQNAKAGDKITLVNIKGEVLSTVNADLEGCATISLPKTLGVYVVMIGTQSFKVIRK